MLKIIKVLIVAVVAIVVTQAAPKNHGTYDQKQHGDYNIRLNLKDFQIIALLDGGLSDFGDYDYNYDYGDLTLKPILPSFTSTAAPINTSESATENSTPKLSTENVTETITNSKNETSDQNIIPPEIVASTSEHSILDESVQLGNVTLNSETMINKTISVIPSLLENADIENKNGIVVLSPSKLKRIELLTSGSSEVVDSSTPIIGSSTTEIPIKKPLFVSQIPGGSQGRRCANGYRKDKRGRCRRLRRRGNIPFEVQLAEFAQRFRQISTSSPNEA